MSLPSYDQYKFCKADWIDALPDHWKLVRIRNLFEIKKRIVGELGYDVIAITQQGVKIKDLEATTGQFSMDYSKYQLVEIGDFAMNHMDLLTGYIDISPFRGVTSPDYRVFSSLDEAPVFNRYFLYLFQHCYRQKIFFAYGQGSSQLGRWRFPTDEFRDFHVPLPSLNEQHAIASFLDRETAKIDKLVAEQERLIALLKEKRQAAVSHAVTKGLNPDVPMKDSGVEWLGGVPEDWDLLRLKQMIVFQRGHDLPDSQREPGDVPVVSSGGFSGSHSIGKAEGPGIVTGRYGSIGKFTFVDREYWPLNTALYSIDIKENHPRFLWYSMHVLSDLFVMHSLKTAVPGIDRNDVHQILTVRPPVREQVEIAKHLDKETERFDAIISAAELAVLRLKERRSALISAAVTGKIDVRGLVSSEEAV